MPPAVEERAETQSNAGAAVRGGVAERPEAAPRQERLAAMSDKDILAAGEVTRLGSYLANRAGEGRIPESLRNELQSVIAVSAQVDNDMLRAVDLLEKSETGPLTDTERQELSSLVGANKHNLALLQTWLGNRTAQLEARGLLTPEAKTLYQALETRLADRHMDLADLICLHELDGNPDEPVSRADRAGARLLHADAALATARQLSAPGLDATARQRLVDDLQAHRDQLARIRDVASGRIEAPGEELELASKTLWEEPLPLVKAKKGAPDEVGALKARWGSGSGEPPLPPSHAKVSEPRMLQEFMKYRLEVAGVAKRDMPDLKSAHADAYNKVLNDQPWDAIVKQVRTTLPSSGGKTTEVQSSIVPAGEMAAHFAEDYPGNGINSGDRTQYKHVPNLARTSLTNADGETLFDGLRHGVLDAYAIDGKMLARLPDDRLETMIGDLLVREGEDTEAPGGEARGIGAGREQRIEEMAARIRGNPAEASKAAEAMRTQASRNMAQEMAAAALVKDPEKFQKALDGETVDLSLSSVSLLTPDFLRPALGKTKGAEQAMLRHQIAAFDELGAGTDPVELKVRDGHGEVRTVKANVRVRQFNFGVNEGAVEGIKAGPVSLPISTPGLRNLMGWGFAMEHNDPHLRELVGPPDDPFLGGDAMKKLDSMAARMVQLREEQSRLQRQLEADGPEHGEAPARRVEIARLGAEVAGIEKNARALSEAGEQIKSIWANREYWRAGGDPYKMVSRLALVGHLMGETPLFNCKSGKDRTGQLDAEVKFLATVADEQNGHLPPVDQDMALWRSARSDFTLNTGNLEMQRLNTGLPGYKLAGVAGLDNLIADGMKPVYRGGSAYVGS